MLDEVDHGDGIRELRLARPPANALDGALLAALRDAVRSAGSDCRAVVLSGRPGMFTAGLDVPALLALDRPAITAVWADFLDLMQALAASPVPVIAGITGHSPAGGAVMAVFCDYRVMAEGAFTIGLNEVAVGLPVPRVVVLALARLVGAAGAERLLSEAALLPPDEALRAGLVDALAPPDEVVPRAVARARRLAALPATAQRVTRREARADLLQAFDAMDGDLAASVADIWFSEETQKAMRALVARLAGRR